MCVCVHGFTFGFPNATFHGPKFSPGRLHAIIRLDNMPLMDFGVQRFVQLAVIQHPRKHKFLVIADEADAVHSPNTTVHTSQMSPVFFRLFIFFGGMGPPGFSRTHEKESINVVFCQKRTLSHRPLVCFTVT